MADELNPLVWFGTRELLYTPKHFTVASTSLTPESKIWILNNLKGRFSCVNHTDDYSSDSGISLFVDSIYGRPAFEDPAEATMYELKWS